MIFDQVLLQRNARVYLAGRQSQKSEDAVEALKKESGKETIFLLPLELGDLRGVRKCAEEFLGFIRKFPDK